MKKETKTVIIKLIILLLNFIGVEVKSQNIESIAIQICDSIKFTSFENRDSLEIINEQITIKSDILKNMLQDTSLVIGLSQGDVKNNFNVFNYKLNRTLNKNCPEYKINHSVLLSFTSVLDIEGIFTPSEIDRIEDAVIKLQKKKKIGLLIVTIDDFYPYNNITDYATTQGNNWRIGSKFKNGGIVLVFSKSLRQVKISTSSVSQKYLTDIESQSIINHILIPKFKNGEFFKGILEFVNELKTII